LDCVLIAGQFLYLVKFESEKVYLIENKKCKIPVLALVPCVKCKNGQVWQKPGRGPE